ncbi:MAG: zinc-dependent metalloprotease [Candidatus Dormibacteria bacterium]
MPRPPMPTLRRTLAAGAFSAGAVVSARALLRPRSTAHPALLDWESVRHTARQRAGSADAVDAATAAAIAARCDAIAAELAPLMVEVVERPLEHFPRFEILDRRGFIDVNIGIARRLLVPVEELRATLGESRVTAMSRGVMNRYIGVLFGIMAQRVLGQYDPVLSLGPPPTDDQTPALYLVEPNLESFAGVAGAPIEPLRRWLILHELTHAWQFGEHPWLRDHLVALMDEMIRSSLAHAVGEGKGRQQSARQVIERLPAAIRTQLRGVAAIQAVMSVLEGYSNFVMHRIGRKHLDNFDELEAAFARRRSQRTLVERLVLAITGINMKMRQYEVGERFCEAVASAGGVTLLNRVWEGPAMMPTPAELRSPATWVARARR